MISRPRISKRCDQINPPRCDGYPQLGESYSPPACVREGSKKALNTGTTRLGSTSLRMVRCRNATLRIINIVRNYVVNVSYINNVRNVVTYSGVPHQRLNGGLADRAWFEQWLVGVTDGNGTFSATKQGGKYNLVFKISKSPYNLRMLYYIKTQLGAGTVYVEGDNAHFLIRDRKEISKIIFPIFDQYPLLTTKQFDYLRLKMAYDLLENLALTTVER